MARGRSMSWPMLTLDLLVSYLAAYMVSNDKANLLRRPVRL
jgi:hypothetical protein